MRIDPIGVEVGHPARLGSHGPKLLARAEGAVDATFHLGTVSPSTTVRLEVGSAVLLGRASNDAGRSGAMVIDLDLGQSALVLRRGASSVRTRFQLERSHLRFVDRQGRRVLLAGTGSLIFTDP